MTSRLIKIPTSDLELSIPSNLIHETEDSSVYELYTPTGYKIIQKNIPLSNISELKCNIIANKLNHPAFLRMYKYYIKDDYIKLIIEPGSCNLKYFYEYNNVNEKIEISALLQLLSAIYYYSSYCIIHNDLFFRNVIVIESSLNNIDISLYNTNFNIPVFGYIFCIADFGMSTLIDTSDNSSDECNYKIDLIALFKSFFYHSKSEEFKDIVKNLYNLLLSSNINSYNDTMTFIFNCIVKVNSHLSKT